MTTAAPSARLRIRLLGGFAAEVAGAVSDRGWRLRKAKTLVKLLALAPGHRLHRDVVVETLWPDADPTAQANNLHQALHAARQALGGDAGTVLLADDVLALGPAVSVDVDAVDLLATRARKTGAVDDLKRAVAAHSGELLPEDQYADWAAAHRERLQEQRAALAIALADALLQHCEATEAVATLRPLVATRPTDEALHRALMRALAATGRRWDATAVYDELRERLDKELAAEPGELTRQLYRELLAGDVQPYPPAGGALPAPTTSFVGRARELDDLAAVLGRSRLVTLSGPGGAGKTRLALELANRAERSRRYSDGVRFTGLADVHDEALVLSTVASALGVTLTQRDPEPRTLAAQVRHRHLLLVLDNCEHLLTECARLAAVLLSECPDLQIVATSRQPLGVPGEVNWRVPSLDLPDVAVATDVAALSRLEAVQLFVDRAHDASTGFTLTPDTAAAVASICSRLDGIPLALELAAARLAHMSVGDVAARLDDALTLLGHRSPGRLDRQETLVATLDWSHELLDAQEQAAFRQLAVFAGGFDLPAAEAVCRADADTVLMLSRLVDKSLVAADTSGSTARYRMLEVVRQYAAARLGESDEGLATQRRHLHWYAESACRNDPEAATFTVTGAEWFARERDNLRAALTAALSTDAEVALGLAVNLWGWWMFAGLFAEGRRWLGLALDAADGAPATRARALFGCAVLDARLARPERMDSYAGDIVRLARRVGPAEELRASGERALLHWTAGDWMAAAEEAAEARAVAERLGAQVELASLLHMQAFMALGRSDHAAALAGVADCLAVLADAAASSEAPFDTATVGHCVDDTGVIPVVTFEETVLLGRQVRRDSAKGHALYTRAWALRELCEWDAAMAAIEDARAAFVDAGDADGEAMALARGGNTARAFGDVVTARRMLDASLRLRQELRDVRGMGLSLSSLALVDAAAGDLDRARLHNQSVADMLGRAGDMSGWSASYAVAATIELLGHDLPAAAAAAEQGMVEHRRGPGGHRGWAWLALTHAACLLELGRADEAATSLDLAGAEFARLGAIRPLARVSAFAKRVQSARA